VGIKAGGMGTFLIGPWSVVRGQFAIPENGYILAGKEGA